jgi:UDP-N-acetylglucosamine 2-epimerase (non-hydrolysing)
MKIITVLGTRPEIIRLSCMIKKLDTYFNHVLVHTGQNWDKNLYNIFFDQLNIRYPDHYLSVVGKDTGETVGNIINKTYKLFLKEKPDALLVLGDTNSGLCVYSAKRLKIPVFHIEAGNRSYNENLPEEINRRLIDHLSDINLCYSENARRNLNKEGIRAEHTFVIGSPLTEVVNVYKKQIYDSSILTTLKLSPQKYFVLSMHREENVDNDKVLKQLAISINKTCDTYKLPVIFSVHPRTMKKLELNKIKLNSLIRQMEPMGYFDYCKLQINAFCVLSDSGSLYEEASILKFPAVSLRDSTERQETIDKGNVIVGNVESSSILNSIKIIVDTHNIDNKTIPSDYIDDNVSTKVVKIIQGYTDIINKVVWYK